MHPSTPGEATYQQAVLDVLGALAYAELTASLRTAADADRAADLGVRLVLARVGARGFDTYLRLEERLQATGYGAEEVMRPFVAAVDAFHDRTRPRDSLEALVKAYVGDGLARDFYREVARRVDPENREFIDGVLADQGRDEALAHTICDELDRAPAQSGRLALWGRRLVGEAIAQTQLVAVERDAMAALLVGAWEVPGAESDLVELGRMLTRLTQTHAERMRRIGLTP